ncbi:hypothetical protein PGT21_015703 [Puccinia graminis f. sp. tritici]|uniref:DNA helicase n=2 Tax=Puccinia graminis f. sp. tritici TaxID=56615 RepID=A0A5B0PDP9_PUCGR|nr:hypothetical protein PGTUg99_012387 [Puccinia graminis f. sp. tritici]KAA1105690.1 hypothetical protein PGT21_015703 [Puccinia graminis f. sp. tritici]
MTNPKDLRAWFEGHLKLLKLERASEKEEFDLLTSEKVKRGQTKLLERMGISIGALGVRSTNIGLGGKTIVELERPAQYHTEPKLPYHTLRSGVPVGIIDNEVGSTKSSRKSSASSSGDKLKVVEGVVSRVTETSIAMTVSSLKDDADQLELPARCRLIKLADTATFDRLEQTMEQIWEACKNLDPGGPSSEKHVKLPAKDSTPVNKDANLPVDSSVSLTETTAKSQPMKTSHRKSSVVLTDLMRSLLGIDPIKTMSEEEINQIDLPPDVRDLNSSQQYAVKHALSPCPVTLVFGPPGTGKTHTLVSIIAALYARGDRIIIAAASNLAIDNIAERLLDLKLPITRLGHPARVLDSLSSSTLEYQLNTSDESEIIRDLKKEINQNLAKLSAQGKERVRGKARGLVYKDVQELRKDYRQRERGHTRNIIKSARIVCATAHGAGSRQLDNEKFDVVIIDESTQAFEAACWIPIVKAKSKLILAGDPLQLPPTVKSMKPHHPPKAQNKKTTEHKSSKKKVKNKPAEPDVTTQDNGEADVKTEDNAIAEVKTENNDESDVKIPIKAEPEADSSSEDDQSDCAKLGQEVKKISLKTPSRRPLMKRPRTLETTMFYRLLKYQPEISCLLNVQYRMHEMIMKFPSDELYESKLTAADSVATHLLKDLPNVTREETDGIADPVLLIDTAGSFMFDRAADEGGEGSLLNENEAELVVQRVNALIESGVLPTQIMVISPYAAQVSLLNSLLKTQYPALAIGSIDSCQGRENEVVIISLCRSNAEGVVGFLSERRRLNVAMTRAKRHLTVIGDSDTLSKGGDFLKNWMNWLEDHAEVRVAAM